MAYVTPIGAAPEQVGYRLTGAHGCTLKASDAQFSYHADGAERPLVWVGAGLSEVGITAGTVLDETQFDRARALMAGLDPRTGERLVTPKLAVYEDAMVALGPLVSAVTAEAAARGVEPSVLFRSGKLRVAYERAVRSVGASGAGALLRADEAGKLADAAGLDVGLVWGKQAYSSALANLNETQVVTGEDGVSVERFVPRRKVVGNLGYDVSFTLPKSHSLLLPFAEDEDAAAVEAVYTQKVGETFDWLEAQTAYGMRGHHGDGETASVVAGSGFLGWSMVHRAARPVGDRVIGDPHWHVHVSIANMTRGSDGKWSTVAAGGRDLMRHAPAVDHVLKALVRRELIDKFGVSFARSERTGAWEVEAIPDATLRAFSKRGASIEAMLRDLGFDPDTASRRAEDLAAAQTRNGKTHATGAPDQTLRSQWQHEARQLGPDPDALIAAALPGPGASGEVTGAATSAEGVAGKTQGRVRDDGGGPWSAPSAAETEEARLRDVVMQLLNPETGLTSSMRRFTRVEALAAVADALPDGARTVAEIEEITDRALADAGFIELPSTGSGQGPEPMIDVAQDVTLAGPAAGAAASVPAQRSGAAAPSSNGARKQIAAGHMANAGRFTTADVVAAEEVILTAARASGQGQGAVRVSAKTAALARSAVEVGQGFNLSDEQAAIVERLVTSDRALDAVLGPPGTGKTTLMRAARAGWEADGYTVRGAATAAVAAQNLATESGIESKTVAQWVLAIKDAAWARANIANGYVPVGEPEGTPPVGENVRRQWDRRAKFGGLTEVDVLVLDEANLTDDRDRAVLYLEAERTGTKLVEVGDPQQLRGVGCGSLFGRVHELVGGAALTANRRQRDIDERAAIGAWRAGKYDTALSSWSERGRFVATETGDQALTAMVATWMTQRTGAPDAHAEMRGVVMLAASNEAVERLNDAAQAVRAAQEELGPETVYEVKAGRTVRLREGDHVLIRLNDRRQRMHEGPDVLNGYRGVVEGIGADGTVRVEWQRATEDGYETERAALSPEFIAKGGVSLGYAMTAHKAEGLTVGADWTQADGRHQGGTVLVYGPGMDEPGLHVATSRHKDRMFLFAGRDQVESASTSYELGAPRDEDQRTRRVIEAMAEQAKRTSRNANDVPVHDDLQRGPERAAGDKRRPAAGGVPTRDVAAAWRELRSGKPAERAGGPAAAAPPASGPDARLTELEERELARRWAAIRARNAAFPQRPAAAAKASAEARSTAAEQEQARREAARREAARRAEEARRRDQRRGPRL